MFKPQSRMTKNVLVVGCGGIGCELIKLLIQEDNLEITLIDFDKIELSNLNRQFLFSDEDIGKFKASVIFEKIKALRPDCNIKFLVDNVKNYDLIFFRQFDVIYNCLDNNESREFVNLMCYLNNTVLIDGGSGGYKGQSCYFDYKEECFDCLPKPVNRSYHVCTVRGIPTKFEHCVEFVKTVIFQELGNPFQASKTYYEDVLKEKLEVNPLEDSEELNIKKIIKLIKQQIKKQKSKKGRKGYKIEYLKDDISTNQLMYYLSCIRAKSAGIETMTFFEAQTVANNIISSICTTNSMIASLMLLSEKNKTNYFLGIGRKCILQIQPNYKREDCATCSYEWLIMNFKKNFTVEEIFEFLKPKYKCKYFLDGELTFFSSLPYNLNEFANIKTNSTATVGLENEDKILKIYFLNEAENFEIV